VGCMGISRESPVQNDAYSDFRSLSVRRIVASEYFRTSPRLCDFLLHICECAIRDAPDEVTETQIGMRVLGRPPGYNASEDNIVRSQARLLRLKLEAYFASEGLTEEYVIEAPKATICLSSGRECGLPNHWKQSLKRREVICLLGRSRGPFHPPNTSLLHGSRAAHHRCGFDNPGFCGTRSRLGPWIQINARRKCA
jgi:hypothetical protein